MGNKPNQTPKKDLMNNALKHYDEASTAINSYYSDIPMAIKKYYAEADEIKFIPYQSCPVCNGTGQVASDGFTSSVYQQCDVCNGEKIIPMCVVEND